MSGCLFPFVLLDCTEKQEDGLGWKKRESISWQCNGDVGDECHCKNQASLIQEAKFSLERYDAHRSVHSVFWDTFTIVCKYA